MQRDTAIVFLTHQWGDSLGRRFERLRRETASFAECHVLLHTDHGAVQRYWEGFLDSIGARDALQVFTPDALPVRLGFPFFGIEKMRQGNTHYPLMDFARSHRYERYWQLESDVEYRGNWHALFSSYAGSDAGLLAAHLHRYAEWPTWCWWPSLNAPPQVQMSIGQLYKAFIPAFRLTREALDVVDTAHRSGWSGHFEVLLPTVLASQGFRLDDFRVHNPCYVGPCQNPAEILPLQSTLRWRPEISLDEFNRRAQGEPLLFHPVKENWWFDGEKVVMGAPISA